MRKFNRVVAVLVISSILLLGSPVGSSARPDPVDRITERRVETLLSQMTLDEKLSLIAGTGFDTVPIDRLKIPAMKMTDGPAGVRIGPSTSFPSGIALAATFDPEIVHEVGRCIAEEAIGKGFNVLLGPAVDIQRVPHAGRNFEAYGEDPFLAATMGVAYINGVQSRNVVATVKHFVANNQEIDRKSIDARVSDRALNEIYFPPFRAAVRKANVLAVMSSYNRVNGSYASENRDLLTGVLKNRWQFRGLVMSDWGAVHSTVPTIRAGLDLEMPTNIFLNPASVRTGLSDGQIRTADIDEMVRRILRVMITSGIFDGRKGVGAVDTADHRAIALKAARESLVLLKNERQTLPLREDSIRSIAVIGPNADTARIGGGGSAQVIPFYSVSPLQGLRDRVGAKIRLDFAPGIVSLSDTAPVGAENLRTADGKPGGLTGAYFSNMEFAGEPAFVRVDPGVNFRWATGSPAENFPADLFSNRWTGYLVAPVTGRYAISLSSNDGGRLYLDDKLIVDVWGDHATLTGAAMVELKAGEPRKIRIDHYENIGNADISLGWRLLEDDLAERAAEAARKSDVAIVFTGLSDAVEAESLDRQDLGLPADQVDLIKKVIAANPRTIVVNTSGAPVLMNDWIDRVPAILQAFYYGQEGGNAIADVLFGRISPSGKLPATFLERWEDSPAYRRYPGNGDFLDYDEDILVGYRWFDAKNIEPQFPFGHGLSYSDFRYRGLKVTTDGQGGAIVSFDITNIGIRDAAEVAQVYVGDPVSRLSRPPKELKGFARIDLRRGETKTVTVRLSPEAFAYYDPGLAGWIAEKGMFRILVGSSSRDIRLTSEFTLRRERRFK